MKRMIVLCLLATFLILCTQQEGVKYTVKGCTQAKYLIDRYEYSDGKITAYIMRNCCSDEIVVEKMGIPTESSKKMKMGRYANATA